MRAERFVRRALPASVVCAFLLAAGSAFAAVQPEPGWGFPRDASVHGHLIDWLIDVTMAFVALLFVIMCAWMGIACVKHGKNHVPKYEKGDGRKPVAMALSLSALIFLVVDGNLFVNSVKDVTEVFWNFDGAEKRPDVQRIEVNARQWLWEARYPGPDGKFNTQDDVVTMDDVRIPVNTPILIQLASADVIHSFYLPNMRQKIDVVPGQVNRMWFEAKTTGEYDIACAQHCGVNHYLMKGKLTVLDRPEYDAWAKQASAVSALAFDADDSPSHWGWAWQEN